jgi:hypothetical protein
MVPQKRTALTPIQPKQRQLTLDAFSSDGVRADDDLEQTSAADATKAARQEQVAARKAAREEEDSKRRAAREAEDRKIAAAPILELPMGKQLVYTRRHEVAIECLRRMQGHLAFDLEWEVRHWQPQPKVAIMQVCDTRNILIYQFASPKTGTSLTTYLALEMLKSWRTVHKEIRDWLASDKQLKLGVNIRGDVQKLRNDFSVDVNGFLDLHTLARAADPDFKETRMVSLQRLAYRYLGKQLEKGPERTSKWDTNPLKPKQQTCA